MEHSLEELVRRHNLELVDVPGDGNCQFHAISHQLTTRYPRTCPSGTYTHKFVRLLAVNGVENMRGEQQSVFRGELIRDKRNKLDENASYGTCLEKLGKDGTWGNHVTLQAIAHQLKDQVFKKDVKIVVYNTMGCPMEVKSWDDSGGNPDEGTVVTLHLGFEGEVHYYSTAPLQRTQLGINNSTPVNGTDVQPSDDQQATTGRNSKRQRRTTQKMAAALCEVGHLGSLVSDCTDEDDQDYDPKRGSKGGSKRGSESGKGEPPENRYLDSWSPSDPENHPVGKTTIRTKISALGGILLPEERIKVMNIINLLVEEQSYASYWMPMLVLLTVVNEGFDPSILDDSARRHKFIRHAYRFFVDTTGPDPTHRAKIKHTEDTRYVVTDCASSSAARLIIAHSPHACSRQFARSHVQPVEQTSFGRQREYAQHPVPVPGQCPGASCNQTVAWQPRLG